MKLCDSFVLLGLLWNVPLPSQGDEVPDRPDSNRPNVVIVMTDDQGYGDLGCTGNPILKTPHLDALYNQSVRLTDYHVSPTCSPTRAAFLTGHWTNRTGAWHTINGRSILFEDEVTMADIFKQNGYATGMFGKWHLGDNYPFRPSDRGFDEVLCHGGGGVGQTPDRWDNAYFDGTYLQNNQPLKVSGFCTDVFFDHAKAFIRTQQKSGNPFLAYIACNAAHSPMHSPPQDAKPYEELGTRVANFFGMIANVDHQVGLLRKLLEQEGLADNTIFIFTTDNGTAAGGKVHNAGMRGTKGSPYDGGHRVPFFLHWSSGNGSSENGSSGNTEPARDVSVLTAHVDILPTLIDLCHLEVHPELSFDGSSLAQVILHPDESRWPDRLMVTDSQRVLYPKKWRNSAVMSSKFRLVNQHELYEMQVDPGQTKNVAADHPDVVKKMTDFYEGWWEDVSPSFEKVASIKIGAPQERLTKLTCHDWFSDANSPWNQSLVRSGPPTTRSDGYWNINITKAGAYLFELRRWPREVQRSLSAALHAGPASHGQTAFRETPGVALAIKRAKIEIAGLSKVIPVSGEEESAVFEISLPAGTTTLRATFETADGTIYGAYYVDVQKK